MRRFAVVLTFVVSALGGAQGCSKTGQFSEPAPSDCTPSCDGKVCGIDGCGGVCGTCVDSEVCSLAGTCVPVCVPDCSNQMCGTDGCGGSCGTCTAPNPLCSPEGRCTDCLPSCDGKLCGDDGCGGSCGTCEPPGQCIQATVTSSASCQCVADCTNRECGTQCDVVCGMGDCGAGFICNDAGRCEACVGSCDGRVCGDDGCGVSCGECPGGNRCLENGTCEDCQCAGSECSADGCCGNCPVNNNSFLVCSPAGLCTCSQDCQPDCTNRSCGPDGCGGICGTACASTQRCTYDRTAQAPFDCRPFTMSSEMTFFVTSAGNVANGGNFGGVAGADALCQQLAQAAGAGARTWVAYLSVTGTAARDRIGAGPWRNAAGAPIVDVSCATTNTCVDLLHSQNVLLENVMTETGDTIDLVNARAVFTGSDAMGNATGMDCSQWTSSDENDRGSAGLADAGQLDGAGRWNSGETIGCDWAGAGCAMGRAHLYCFAP